MSHYKQFHANPDLFADPYLNVNKQFLSSLATCPNQHLAGCASNASTPHQVAKTSSDVFHKQPPARSIPLAKQPVQENFQNGNASNQPYDLISNYTENVENYNSNERIRCEKQNGIVTG